MTYWAITPKPEYNPQSHLTTENYQDSVLSPKVKASDFPWMQEKYLKFKEAVAQSSKKEEKKVADLRIGTRKAVGLLIEEAWFPNSSFETVSVWDYDSYISWITETETEPQVISYIEEKAVLEGFDMSYEHTLHDPTNTTGIQDYQSAVYYPIQAENQMTYFDQAPQIQTLPIEQTYIPQTPTINGTATYEEVDLEQWQAQFN